MDEALEDLPSVMIEFRRRTGMTQTELASKLGISDRYVRAAEHGQSLGPRSLRKLAKVMRESGDVQLARFVSQMTLSERDFRSLEVEIGLLRVQVARLQERVTTLEMAQQMKHRGAA